MSTLSFQNADFFDSFDGDFRNKIFRSSIREFELTIKKTCLSIKFPFNFPEIYITDKQQIIIPPNHYCIVNPKEEIYTYSNFEETGEAMSIFLCEELVKEVFSELKQRKPSLVPPDYDRLSMPVFFEKNIPVESDPLGKLLIQLQLTDGKKEKSKALFYTLAERMIREQQPHLNGISRISALKIATRMEIYRRLDLAKDFIHDNVEASFGVSDVARFSMMSEYSFIRQFRQVYHRSPYQYILQQKINRAKMLLGQGNSSIQDIADRLGFADLSTFGKCFRKWTGKTATQFRIDT